ncbi:hypothetical protein PMIN04_000179 [Paraphaeosphaeria minitans]
MEVRGRHTASSHPALWVDSSSSTDANVGSNGGGTDACLCHRDTHTLLRAICLAGEWAATWEYWRAPWGAGQSQCMERKRPFQGGALRLFPAQCPAATGRRRAHPHEGRAGAVVAVDAVVVVVVVVVVVMVEEEARKGAVVGSRWQV